eukprot:Gregarina_sp_Poly_1__2814@NODE_1782_length_3337_cov_32_956575_g1160_i0_p3_GENE_NODE_1782_length_3337_cov_32_956575_g1160_i0NODE_1782_length_3337_cov_32_956575_g1160_i0_p3_ORF_typecomplete_len103_score1_37MerRDNAbind/PF09278_11/0_017_NODE_1782_length_3337_cov_32_956575_g1160_i011591467
MSGSDTKKLGFQLEQMKRVLPWRDFGAEKCCWREELSYCRPSRYQIVLCKRGCRVWFCAMQTSSLCSLSSRTKLTTRILCTSRRVCREYGLRYSTKQTMPPC